MRRFVSVWLPHLAIERQAGLKPGQVPVEHAFGLVETGARGLVITAVNQVARQHGIVPGLPLADARAALPALLTGAADRDGDAAYLRDLALWCGRYGPDRNTDGCDELWIDTTGVAHLFARPGASSASPPIDT